MRFVTFIISAFDLFKYNVLLTIKKVIILYTLSVKEVSRYLVGGLFWLKRGKMLLTTVSILLFGSVKCDQSTCSTEAERPIENQGLTQIFQKLVSLMNLHVP